MAAFGDHPVEQEELAAREALAARLDAASDQLPTAWDESFAPMLDSAQGQWREQSADALRSLHVHLLRLRELLLYAPDAHKRLRAQLQQATSCSERAFQVLRQSGEAEEKQGRARAAKIQIETRRAAEQRAAVTEATRLRAALLEEQRRGEAARRSWAAGACSPSARPHYGQFDPAPVPLGLFASRASLVHLLLQTCYTSRVSRLMGGQPQDVQRATSVAKHTNTQSRVERRTNA